MGNCGLGSWADDEGELTQERLLEAVESMDVDEVERCLNGGVPVNKSIDAKGHTLLDKFAAEHAAMLRDALHYAGTPGEATKLLVEKQEAAAQTLKVLLQHGAILSGRSALTAP